MRAFKILLNFVYKLLRELRMEGREEENIIKYDADLCQGKSHVVRVLQY